MARTRSTLLNAGLRRSSLEPSAPSDASNFERKEASTEPNSQEVLLRERTINSRKRRLRERGLIQDISAIGAVI